MVRLKDLTHVEIVEIGYQEALLIVTIALNVHPVTTYSTQEQRDTVLNAITVLLLYAKTAELRF